MRKIFNILIMCIMLFPYSIYAQETASNGIKFFQGTWEEAISIAKKQNKALFVDFYAVWCGPCKKMSNEVFTLDSVGNYFNDKFINLKIDVEKKENAAIVEQFKIHAFPTLMFLGNDGTPISVNVGAMDAQGLIEAAKTAIGELIGFKKLYKMHLEDPENLELQQKMLLQASRFLMAQDGMNAEKWVVRIQKLYNAYLKAKMGPALINKQDYIIITQLQGSDKEEKEKIVDFINSTLVEWRKVLGDSPAYYVIEFNDQMIEGLAKEGNVKYKEYVDKIKGDYKDAYAVLSLSGGVDPYDLSLKYADAIYSLYKGKDISKYKELMQEYFVLLGTNVESMDYGKAAQNLYYVADKKLTDADHTLAIQWLKKALEGENPIIDRINFLVMIGDSYTGMKKYDEAEAYYRQGYAESLQLTETQDLQQMMQVAIIRKLTTLDLLKK